MRNNYLSELRINMNYNQRKKQPLFPYCNLQTLILLYLYNQMIFVGKAHNVTLNFNIEPFNISYSYGVGSDFALLTSSINSPYIVSVKCETINSYLVCGLYIHQEFVLYNILTESSSTFGLVEISNYINDNLSVLTTFPKHHYSNLLVLPQIQNTINVTFHRKMKEVMCKCNWERIYILP